jgi:hypothetical protein
MERNKGTSYVLYDDPKASLLGILAVGYDRNEVLSTMVGSLTFIQSTLSVSPFQP